MDWWKGRASLSEEAMKWIANSRSLDGQKGIKISLSTETAPLSTRQVIRLWQESAEFRGWFNGLLIASPFAAFRWETPAVTIATAGRTFECVLLDRPELTDTPDVNAFAEHFRRANGKTVIAFPNLGRDAILIVPCPGGPLLAYSHLGVFVRNAPPAQIHAFWQAVGQTLERRLGTKPVWLNTAGAGVAWLHIRLDDRPKYYAYIPYRSGN